MALDVLYAHPIGTRAALDALAGAAALEPGVIYILGDEDRIAVALTASSYETFAKENESPVTPSALTKTDDTNVTLTLGGSPTTALLAAASLTLGWTGTLAVARGGTGSGTASGARTNLGLVIGTDVQAQNANLSAIAGLTSAADRVPYFTGSGAAALATLTTAGRALIDDADAAAQRTTLGLGSAALLNIAVGTSAPGSPAIGDLWVDTN